MADPILFNDDFDFLWGEDYDWPDEEDTDSCRHCGGEGYFPGNNFGTFEMSYPDAGCDECEGTGLKYPPQYIYGPSYSLETEIELAELKNWAEKEQYRIDYLQGVIDAADDGRTKLLLELKQAKEEKESAHRKARYFIERFKKEIDFAARQLAEWEIRYWDLVKNMSKIIETQMAPVQIIMGERKSEG